MSSTSRLKIFCIKNLYLKITDNDVEVLVNQYASIFLRTMLVAILSFHSTFFVSLLFFF